MQGAEENVKCVILTRLSIQECVDVSIFDYDYLKVRIITPSYFNNVSLKISFSETVTDIKSTAIYFQVMPRLNDEKWYPGFSSVYRILATIKEKGMHAKMSK